MGRLPRSADPVEDLLEPVVSLRLTNIGLASALVYRAVKDRREPRLQRKDGDNKVGPCAACGCKSGLGGFGREREQFLR